MSVTVEELTVNYEEDGILVVKELDKAILTKGAWATVVFRFQQWEKAKNAYSPDRYVVRRYKKMNGEYRSQSKFTISSPEQAKQLTGILLAWLEGREAPELQAPQKNTAAKPVAASKKAVAAKKNPAKAPEIKKAPPKPAAGKKKAVKPAAAKKSSAKPAAAEKAPAKPAAKKKAPAKIAGTVKKAPAKK